MKGISSVLGKENENLQILWQEQQNSSPVGQGKREDYSCVL